MADKKLPRIMKKDGRGETKEYFDFMGQFIKDFEKALPVKVYGFTYYNHVAYYWYSANVDVNGKLILSTELSYIPFGRALKIVYPDDDYTTETGSDYLS